MPEHHYKMWQQTQKRTVYYSGYHEVQRKFSYFDQKRGTVRQKMVKKTNREGKCALGHASHAPDYSKPYLFSYQGCYLNCIFKAKDYPAVSMCVRSVLLATSSIINPLLKTQLQFQRILNYLAR